MLTNNGSIELSNMKEINRNKNDDKNDDKKDDKKMILTCNIYDQRKSGVTSGTFMNGEWVTRSLNKINGNASITLNKQQSTFTFQPGTYTITCDIPAYNVGIHQARLFDVTNNEPVKYGNSGISVNTNSNSHINYFTGNLKKSTTFRIEHYCESIQIGNGFGIASNFPSNCSVQHFEIYTEIQITQFAA